MAIVTGLFFTGLIPAFWRPLSVIEANSVLRTMIVWLSLVGIAFATTEGLRNRGRLDAVLQRLTYFATFSAIIAAIQFFTGADPTDWLKPPGLIVNESELGLSQVRADFNRVVGTASHAIEFGVVMAMILPIALHYAFHARTKNEQFWRWCVVVVIGTGVPFSVSRSSTLALATVLIVLAGAWTIRRRVQVAFVGFFGVVAFGAAVPGLLGTIRGLFKNIGQDTSIDARTADYEIAYVFIEEAPWLGRGFGTFVADEYLVLDNQYLLSTIEGGIVGLAALFAIFFLGIGLAQRIQKITPHEETRHLARAIQASFVAGMLTAFTFDALFFFTFEGTLMLLLGCLGALLKVADVEPVGAKRRSLSAVDKPIKPMWPSPEWKEARLGASVSK